MEVRGLDVAREVIAEETGRTKANRKLLAAEVACDLMLDYGGVVPTLTGDGQYIRLAGLLYFVATGKRATWRDTADSTSTTSSGKDHDFYPPGGGRAERGCLPAISKMWSKRSPRRNARTRLSAAEDVAAAGASRRRSPRPLELNPAAGVNLKNVHRLTLF